MERIIMLGTGNGFVYDLFNTCFILDKDNEYFLVDTGGGVDIVKNIEKVNIDLNKIHNIFISHSHTDHILGLFWILKRLGSSFRRDKYEGKLNIYCNDEVAHSIKNIYPNLYPDVYVSAISDRLNIIVLKDNETRNICGVEYTFFDVLARKNKMYGFETIINNKKLVFIGDETCNIKLYDRLKNSDYLMHEAFCLDSEQDIFNPYEKKHSTVKSVCENFNNLNIKNLILFHTEDTHSNKKELYTIEGKKYFNNNIIVPNDLDIIELN